MSEDKIIEDMSLDDEKPVKDLKDKEGEEIISDMALDEESEKKEENFDMSLETPSFSELETRIAKLFPDENYIYITPDAPLCKLSDGKYSLRSIPIADLTDDWKKKLDDFLKSKRG